MTRPTLRLVVGSPDGSDTSVELPTSGPSTLHVHLHLGATPVPLAAPMPPAVEEKAGQSENGWGRNVLLACSACILVLVSYEVGSHSTGPGVPTGRRLPLPPQAAFTLPNPGELPLTVRRQLASPPVLTPPPGSQDAAGAVGNPFGLHP